MANHLSDEEWLRTTEALERNNGNQSRTAVELGIPRTTLINRIYSARARKLIPDGPPLDGYRVKGVSSLYGSDGELKATWVKTDLDKPSVEEIASQVRAAFADYEPPPHNTPSPQETDADLATVYPLADWHVGLLSWKKETGHNYDLKIGQGIIKTAMTRLVGGSPNAKQGVVLGLGDLLHSDNYEGMTARSKNILDVDGRYPRVLQAATQLIIYTVDLALQKHETILLRILPGNHDEQSALAVTLALSMFYHANPRVTVDDDAGRFWFWAWGKVLLGATHGDKAKMKDLPLIMATRNPEAWGKAKFRHIYTGHIHNEKAMEQNGVTVESFQTPVAPDSWHVAMGYGAGRSVSAVTHHKERGEVMRHKVNIIPGA
jgi:hypothetical protein